MPSVCYKSSISDSSSHMHTSGACSAQCSCIRTHRSKGDFCWRHINHLPLRISSVCFTLFTAILLRSLISCIIEQPVYKSQAGCDGCVCVRVVGWLDQFSARWCYGFLESEKWDIMRGWNNFKPFGNGRYKKNDQAAGLHVCDPIFKSISWIWERGVGNRVRACTVCVKLAYLKYVKRAQSHMHTPSLTQRHIRREKEQRVTWRCNDVWQGYAGTDLLGWGRRVCVSVCGCTYSFFMQRCHIIYSYRRA